MKEVFKNIIKKLEELKNRNPFIQWKTDKCRDASVSRQTIDYAIEIVKKTAEEYNNGWIPCSERLPTTEEYQRGNGRFLVTDGNRTYEAEFDIYESHTFGKSRMATDWFVTDKCVTHWQNEPLPPKPYQPKGE